MNLWLAAAIALSPALTAAIYASLHRPLRQRVVAAELAAAIGVLMLAMVSFAFNQLRLLDIAVLLALFYLPGTLIAAHFLQRWLWWRRS